MNELHNVRLIASSATYMKRGFLKSKASGQKAAVQANHQSDASDKGTTASSVKPKTEDDKTQGLNFVHHPSTGWTLKYSEHILLHLVVPASDSTGDGTTDCLLLGLEDQKLIPKYPSRVRKPATCAYEIRDSKTGLGMFATQDIQIGDLILSERPILLLPRLIDSTIITGPATFYPPSKNPANRAGWESIFCPFFDRLSKEKQDGYRSLSNSHPEDGIGPLLGTCRTNSFEVTLDETGQRGGLYCTVYKTISRVNHSCAGSNTQPRFDPKSFSIELRAARDIKAGDEILVTYCSDCPGTTAERQMFLGCYGFQCTCASCSRPASSDRLYLKFLSSDQHLDESYELWLKDRTLPDNHISKPSIIWTSLMEQEGLPSRIIYIHHLDIITKSFVALGDLENAMKHGMKAARFMVTMTGREYLLKERSDPNFYLRDRSFGIRRRTGKGQAARRSV